MDLAYKSIDASKWGFTITPFLKGYYIAEVIFHIKNETKHTLFYSVVPSQLDRSEYSDGFFILQPSTTTRIPLEAFSHTAITAQIPHIHIFPSLSVTPGTARSYCLEN